MVDDKLRILAAMKAGLGPETDDRVFPRQGHYAHDPEILASYPPADLTVERIGDLANYDLPTFLGGALPPPPAFPPSKPPVVRHRGALPAGGLFSPPPPSTPPRRTSSVPLLLGPPGTPQDRRHPGFTAPDTATRPPAPRSGFPS